MVAITNAPLLIDMFRLRAEVVLAAVETLREHVVVVEYEIGMPEHVDQQRRVGDRHHAYGILPGIDVPVPGIERRRKYRAFFPLQCDRIIRIALPDPGPSLSG